jgi:tripartite ATP-independent transporter DctM subunit
MGETIPPSTAMLVLGSITTLPVASLFMGGILPAVVMGVAIMLIVWLRGRRRAKNGQVAALESVGAREKVILTVRALPALGVPIILAGGMATGFGTPTEVSALAVVYSFLMSGAVYRRLNLATLRTLASGAASMAGMILFIISAGGAFSWSLTVAQISAGVGNLVSDIGGNKVAFLLICIVVLSLMGSVLEGMPALLIFAPLLTPIAESIGIQPIVFGMVLLITDGIGCFAPPIGVGSYVIGAVCETSVEKLTKTLLVYLSVTVAGLLVIAFIPGVTTVVPKLLGLSLG